MIEIEYNDPNIIDGDGIEIESAPIYGDERDGIQMNSIESEENKAKEGWTKMPSTNEGEIVFPNGVKAKVENEEKEGFFKRKKGTKVTKEEILEEQDKDNLILLTKIFGVTIALVILAIVYNLSKDKVANWFKDFKADLTKTNNEESLNEEPNYDNALAEVGATIDEETKQSQDLQEASQSIEEGADDEVLGGKVLAFNDAKDDEQVRTRAKDINIYLKASGVNDISDEELCNQIKFINGTYNASTDDEAWDIYNDCLQTFADYSVATEQSANFAGDVVADNGVRIALGFDAFLTDTCEHRELMDEVSNAFIKVLEASTQEEKIDASQQMLKLEADLMLGQKETPNGTQLYFHSLTSSEAFITGLMFQNANATIHSALGENIELTYTDNIGQEVRVKYDTLNEYYNPQCNGEYNTENAWAIVSTDLVETAIAKGLDLTFNQ